MRKDCIKGREMRVYVIVCGTVPQFPPSVISCLPLLRASSNTHCILAWYSAHCGPNEQLLSLNFNS